MTAEKATAVLAGILCCGVLVSARQAIHLEFNDGRVWLLAHDAPGRAASSSRFQTERL